MNQQYRINAKLRRRGEPALDSNRVELCSEDYDDDEEFVAAVASAMLENIKEDREYIETQEGNQNDDNRDDNERDTDEEDLTFA